MCFFILWLDLLLIFQGVKLLLKHCCLLPCSLSRGLKAWIATHPPPLHQKPETSARGFFCSPLGHVWFPQGLERIQPGILMNFIRPCIAGIRSGQEWPQPNGPLPFLAKITKWVGQDYPFCVPYREQRNIQGLGKGTVVLKVLNWQISIPSVKI